MAYTGRVEVRNGIREEVIDTTGVLALSSAFGPAAWSNWRATREYTEDARGHHSVGGKREGAGEVISHSNSYFFALLGDSILQGLRSLRRQSTIVNSEAVLG